MSLLNNNRKTNLLFRQFVGTANALLPENSNFTNEPLKNINYVFNSEIQNQEVPLSLPSHLRISALDICNNIPSDSSFNLAAYGYPQLTFFKDIPLDPVPGAASQVWFKYIDQSANPLTNQSNNLLIGMIPFKFDDVNVLDPTYLPIVKRNFAIPPSTNFVNVGAPNNTPLYWIQNSANGLIQFYATTTVLNSNNIQDITVSGVQDYTKAPTLSFYKYTGTYGAGGGGGGGTSSDISDLYQKLYNLNRVVLPDGYVDISGTNYDLCGNEVVRTYYTYNRDKMYIGYDNLPILDGSAVDHAGDPSFNSINQPSMILTISGNTFMSGGLVQGFFDPPNLTALQGIKGQYSHAEGYRTWAEADYAHTEGRENTINFVGIGSHGEGFRNDISGLYCHAEGFSNNIGEDSAYCHAEGIANNIPLGTGSHIEGNGNIINVTQHPAHAEGAFNQVGPLGAYAHAEGFGTIIDTSGGHSTGHYNDISQNVIFVVGCGSSNVNRMDALYVDTNCITHINNRLEVSGNTFINGDVDISKDLIVRGDGYFYNNLYVISNGLATNLLCSQRVLIQPTSPNLETYVIAKVEIDPLQNPINALGYFEIEVNDGSPEGYMKCHFLAGTTIDGTSNNPPGYHYNSFINVLSLNRSYYGVLTEPGIENIRLYKDQSTIIMYLAFSYRALQSFNVDIRLYKNSVNQKNATDNIYWTIVPQLLPPASTLDKDIYIGAADPLNYPYHPQEPLSTTTNYFIVDNSVNIYGDLYNIGDINLQQDLNIRGDIISTDPSGILDISATLVDISGSLEVENNVLVNGQVPNSEGMSLDVYGNAAVRGKFLVDISSSIDDGITIQNTGSGGPMIKLRHQSNSYLGNAQYHTIYVDDPGDNMHIDFGTGSGSHTLYLDGNTNSSTIVTGENQGTGNTLFQAKVQNGMTTNLVAGNSGRGSLTVNNGFTSGSTPGGIDIQCSGTPSPEHCFYIGSSTLSNVGRAISLKGLTETGGGFSIFTSGEVRINSLLGGGTYEDIDFAVNTVDISNAFFVDAALNLIIFGVSAEIPNIIGPTSISGDTTINGNLSVNGNTYIDEDLSVNAVTTLTDLSFSDYLNNVARLPSETTIPFRKHQTVSSGPYRDLKVDGYSEYSITTENLSTTNSQEDWVTIARVGFQDMTTQSQRADGLFEITCNNSGTHQTIRLEASHHYKNGQTLDVVKNVTYGLNSNRHIKAARMAYASIYDGGILQIQISQNTSSTTYTLSKITIKLYYNNNNFGWTSDLSGVSAPLPDNTPSGYSQAGYGGTGNQLWDGSTYSNFILFYPSIEGIDLTERIFAAGNPGQSVLNYTSDMILNKVYMKDDLDLSGNGITNIGSITTNHLLVETSGGSLLFEVEHNNNTAKLGLPLELERDTIANLSGIQEYSMAVANNIGSSWSSNTAYYRDCLVWRPQITSATPSVRILENEHIVQIYNRQLAGSSSAGGFGGGTQDNNYVKYTGTTTKVAYLGVMPNGANANATSSLPVNSKMHFIREAWITGLYLNTPFLDSPTFSGSSGSQGLFGFGANDYIDIEVGAPSGSVGYKSLYRIGNPNTGIYDSFYFPSSTWDATTGGVSITLPADEWIYIPAGTNMSRCVRFKAYINSNIWVRNDYSGTSFNRGHVEGYLVYVTSPKMII